MFIASRLRKRRKRPSLKSKQDSRSSKPSTTRNYGRLKNARSKYRRKGKARQRSSMISGNN